MDSQSAQYEQAQIDAILGPDPAQFETLISHVMSSGKKQRSQAAKLYNLCKRNHPDELCIKLTHSLQSSPQAVVRGRCAIKLRSHLTRFDPYDTCMWPRLSPSTQSMLKSQLLVCLQQEDSKIVSKKLRRTVSELASEILPEGGWPEILPFMFQCVSSDSPRLQKSALLMFSQLSKYIGETLIPYLDTLHSLFLKCLASSSNSDVWIAAFRAAINIIRCLSSPSNRDRFQDLLPVMMQTLTEALKCGQEATAEKALELLIELARTDPNIFRRQLVDVVGSMFQIAEAESLEEQGPRILAIEFVFTLDERAPGMLQKLPQFSSRFSSVLKVASLYLEDDPEYRIGDDPEWDIEDDPEDIEDDPEWHNAASKDEDAGEIGIKTSVLEEKATACNMLCCYADELKEGFYPWIDQVATTLGPLLKSYFHEVRKAAVSAMPELLRSAKLEVEKGQAQSLNETYIKQLSDYIIPALVEALHKILGPLLDESQVRCIVNEIKQVITASSTRKRERAERAKAEDFDAEEGELLKRRK